MVHEVFHDVLADQGLAVKQVYAAEVRIIVTAVSAALPMPCA
jgi:hypothetical protein